MTTSGGPGFTLGPPGDQVPGPEELRRRVLSAIADVPDFPQPGVLFKDINPVLADPVALNAAIAATTSMVAADDPEAVAGIEARGFILGAPLAVSLGRGFVAVRKAGKLPPPVLAVRYDLEYGSAALELAQDVVRPGQRVVVVDDVLATGGTVEAACTLLERAGAVVTSVVVLLEIGGLGGRARLVGRRVDSFAVV